MEKEIDYWAGRALSLILDCQPLSPRKEYGWPEYKILEGPKDETMQEYCGRIEKYNKRYHGWLVKRSQLGVIKMRIR